VGVSVSLADLADAHFGVIDALASGDGALAGRLLRGHVEQVRSFVEELVPEGQLSLREI
jgi:DNA-binding GntR family transcriptional regulator